MPLHWICKNGSCSCKAEVIVIENDMVHFGLVFSEDDDNINFFPPFTLFKNAAVEFLEDAGIECEEYNDQILFMWSIVQGLGTIFTLKGVNILIVKNFY
ncbi:MAG: hypothetical protein PHG41_02320 [Actinomycetota bacterium]|nr:hypothetical protein [Actinomycetota bacterium]